MEGEACMPKELTKRWSSNHPNVQWIKKSVPSKPSKKIVIEMDFNGIETRIAAMYKNEDNKNK